MTPKEKALSLLHLFIRVKLGNYGIDKAKKCAIIAVDEMINMSKLYHNHNIVLENSVYTELVVDYWKEVKEEIEKI